MASSNQIKGVILSSNPRSHIPEPYPPNQPPRPLQEILDENEQLRIMIDKIKEEKVYQEQRVNKQAEPEGHRMEFQRRLQHGKHRIQELESVVLSQQRVIEGYRQKFKDFEDNLIKIMKLDKDIHHRLVNPQPNPTFETNVRNVLVALNGRAPYDKIMKMIESIRV